jgi:broad specificity phosphatase PhoE
LKQLYFVRHGQTEWNAIHRMQGQWNSDLNERGRAQADVNGQLLSTLGIEALFVSPLDRTRQTADIINQYLKLPINLDDRIKEWDCGDWSGYLYEEVAEKWASEWQAYHADRFHYRGPNCENFPDMIERATPFLEELAAHPAQRIAIISHGMIGKIMVATLLQLGEAETLAFGQDNDVVFNVGLDDDSIHARHFVRGEGPFDGHAPV